MLAAFGAVVVVGGGVLGVFAMLRAAAADRSGQDCGGGDCAEAATDGFRTMPFGPFLFVPPGEMAPAATLATTPEVTDVSLLTGSPYYIALPAAFTRASISGRAAGANVVEVDSDWFGPDGAHVSATVRKVDASELPIEVQYVPIETHRLVRHKVLNGRYAAIETAATCGHDPGGTVTVWIDGATLTLSSPDAASRDLERLVSTMTTRGPLD